MRFLLMLLALAPGCGVETHLNLFGDCERYGSSCADDPPPGGSWDSDEVPSVFNDYSDDDAAWIDGVIRVLTTRHSDTLFLRDVYRDGTTGPLHEVMPGAFSALARGADGYALLTRTDDRMLELTVFASDGGAEGAISLSEDVVARASIGFDGSAWIVAWRDLQGQARVARVAFDGADLRFTAVAIPDAAGVDHVAVLSDDEGSIVILMGSARLRLVRLDASGTLIDPESIVLTEEAWWVGGVADDGAAYVVPFETVDRASHVARIAGDSVSFAELPIAAGESVSSVASTGDGSVMMAITSGLDGTFTVRRWDGETLAPSQAPFGGYSPRLVAADDWFLVTASADGSVLAARVWADGTPGDQELFPIAEAFLSAPPSDGCAVAAGRPASFQAVVGAALSVLLLLAMARRSSCFHRSRAEACAVESELRRRESARAPRPDCW